MPRAEILAATPTLFAEDGELDPAANKALFGALRGRVDGVFVAGTTGEFPALDAGERGELVRLALEVFGPEGTVVHVGAAATRDAVRLTRDAVAAGAVRLAALTPYYLPVDGAAVERYFAAVTAAAGEADVYGYLFPDRTGVEVSAAEFAALSERTGLAGAKLSGGAAEAFGEYRAALPTGTAKLWSGADTELAAVVRGGGAGVVSGLSAAFPEPFAALAAAVAEDDAEAERAAQARADAVLSALHGAPEGIKAALAAQGIGTGAMRMPAPRVTVQQLTAIRGLVDQT
jgi:4-hydroxy-tetrahydrodipicolinate synthase